MWWQTGPHLRRRMHQQERQKAKLERVHTGEGWMLQKLELTNVRRGEMVAHDGDPAEFIKILKSKYGSVTRAWRLALDSDESGVMDFREFRMALSSLGYEGNVRTLWYRLDEDHSGCISLKELDADAASALEKFRALAVTKCGSIENCWKSILDADGSNTVSKAEFLERIHELGYTDMAEAVELFGYLQVKLGLRFITLEDIRFLQGWEDTKQAAAYRQRHLNHWVNKDPYLHKEVVMPGMHDDRNSYEFVVAREPEQDVKDFKDFLISKYGSLVEAFDKIDANGNGSLSLLEFQAVVSTVLRYCRQGEARRLFLMLHSDPDGVLTFEELGISTLEWSKHLCKTQNERRKREFERAKARMAPVGTSPRQVGAVQKHMARIQEPPPQRDVAFWTTVPTGWGLPAMSGPAQSWTSPEASARLQTPRLAPSLKSPPQTTPRFQTPRAEQQPKRQQFEVDMRMTTGVSTLP
eukprot:TRINITY_DN75573_c0_g1_i1.p1 TRINITY_DN75573_c0_g1~~TRINITY_DN75573_c0_g1_i1.p1  ORF type:complete len:467 (-),score=108.01 TRINITY_DN75573_c0_g1_i1:281-1681(-)